MTPNTATVRKSIGLLISLVILVCVGLLGSYPSPTKTLAQDNTPTDIPFPTAEKTEKPQPTANPTAGTAATPSASAATAAATGAATSAATTARTPTLTLDNAMATITAVQAENKTLQDQLASAQTDKGATLYAVVIVVIGLLLSFAVFFGLRRTG